MACEACPNGECLERKATAIADTDFKLKLLEPSEPWMVSEAGPKEKPPCDVRCIAADSKDDI